METRNAKNKKWSDKIEEQKKESRLRLLKDKLCAEISKYGWLWLMEENTEDKLAEMETDSEKHATLKCPLQFMQKVISVSKQKHVFLSERVM